MILCFGEVLIDCLPSGDVIGGAPFNVGVHLKRFGLDVSVLTKIGVDKYGAMIQSFCEQEDLMGQIQFDDRYDTGYVKVTLNNGEPSYEIVNNCAWEYIDGPSDDLTGVEAIVYGTLALYSEYNQRSFIHCKNLYSSATKICDLNLREPYYNQQVLEMALLNADILKLNANELSILSKIFVWGEMENEILVSKVKRIFNIKQVLLTKGEKGAEIYIGDDVIEKPAPEVTNFVDAVGAGDAFTASFVNGLVNDMDPEDNMKKALEFAAQMCQVKGAIPDDLTVYQQ